MTNHFFIGLGGQGCRTLAELRKVMTQRERDANRLKDLHIHFEFLAIDSSMDVRNERKCWTYFGEDLSLKAQDWIALNSVRTEDVARLSIQTDVAPWLGNRQQMADFVDNNQGIEGANQRRRFGRLLFAHNADRIREAIVNQKVSRLTATGTQQCAFHIFASVAGGTGSGCLIDIITTIRTQYPNGELDRYPIFVYIYSTHNDGQGAVVGYFYQNQFAALRDLNALMCDNSRSGWAPHLLGAQVRGRTYSETGSVLQTVLTTSINSKNMGVPLSTQIRIVAESCFERIFALATGNMDARIQQSITGQDIVGNFPGEPERNPERSYRFSGMGMRRWEVPHRKVHELLATNLMASGLRQMLYSHWTNNQGYSDSALPMEGPVVAALLNKLDSVVSKYLISEHQVKDLTRTLREDILKLAKNQLREKGAHVDLQELNQLTRHYYEQLFQEKGVSHYFQVLQRNQAAQINEVVQQLDAMLTEFWLDATSPIALVHIPDLIEALASFLRGKAEQTANFEELRQRLNRVPIARIGEWAKITPLSALVGKRSALYLAQAQDLAGLHSLDLQERCARLDASVVNGILGRLQQIRAGYGDAQSYLRELHEQTTRETQETNTDLVGMHGADGANKYELDTSALAVFLQKMESNEVHQRNTAMALRMLVKEMLNQRPLTALSGQNPTFLDRLETAIRQTAFDRARDIHQDLEQRREAPRILEPSLLRVLEHRFGSDERTLETEINQFVSRAVSCLLLQDAESPSDILGRNRGVPDKMPRKGILLGLPNDNPTFAQKIEAAFLAARGAGEEIVPGTYRHDDPSQLRLLCVDYWLAARFTTVANKLAETYKGANDSTRYFCNLDPSGEEDKRPPLFLPTPAEMRNRYEAELWLAKQPPFGIIKEDQHGVSLIQHGRTDEHQVIRLGPSLQSVLSTANHEPMFHLHAVLGEVLQKQPDGGRKVVADLIEEENKRLEKDPGITSPEYFRWKELRKHLQGLTI